MEYGNDKVSMANVIFIQWMRDTNYERFTFRLSHLFAICSFRLLWKISRSVFKRGKQLKQKPILTFILLCSLCIRYEALMHEDQPMVSEVVN